MYICIFNNYEMDLRFGLILEEIFPFDPSSLSWKIATYFKVNTKESLSSCKKNIDSHFVLTLR